MDSVFYQPFAKVDNNSEFQTRETEIGEHLRLENGIPLTDSLVVHENNLINL